MRILVLGATGFTGRHIVSVLLGHGHGIVGAGRRTADLKRVFPEIETLPVDLRTTTESEWFAALRGIDAVVNVAGSLNRKLAEVHVDGPTRLYRAARQAGVQRIVLISAISARTEVTTEYAKTKLAGEAAVKNSGVPWTILRPSMIVAKDSFGGSSVIRGMAGLPFIAIDVPMSEALFSPLHARDLGEVVHKVLLTETSIGAELEPVGQQTMSLRDLVAAYREWLGISPAIARVAVPGWIVGLVGTLGERMGGPISTTAIRQLAAGNGGDSSTLEQTIGFELRGLRTIFRDEPAGVQDRWHARLYFAAIGIRATLVLLWLGSALAGLVNGHGMATQFVTALGLPMQTVAPLVIGTALLDLGIAALLLTRWSRTAALVQAIVVLGYTLGIGFVLPELWADPFGALLKNLPILALIAVNAVTSEQR